MAHSLDAKVVPSLLEEGVTSYLRTGVAILLGSGLGWVPSPTD